MIRMPYGGKLVQQKKGRQHWGLCLNILKILSSVKNSGHGPQPPFPLPLLKE